MKLFKNVDICDLESILKKGILSMDESENDNWESGNRANNATDLVYLFEPKTELNTFPRYGIALIEVEVDDAKLNEFSINDGHKDDYVEYVIDKVDPSCITNIYIPELLKNRLDLNENVLSKTTFVEMSARDYIFVNDDFEKKPASKELLKVFAETTTLNTGFNFFRGRNSDGTLIDLYDFKYHI